MYTKLTRRTLRRSRPAVLATCLTALFMSVMAGPALAAPSVNLSIDDAVAGHDTAMTANMSISGSGSAGQFYGGSIVIPRNLHLETSNLGAYSQQCLGSTFSTIDTGVTPAAIAFDATSCPATAKIGTATLGALVGEIYAVRSSSPQFGIQFNTGTPNRFGRKLAVTYPSGNTSMTIQGLPAKTSTGLTLVFENPQRPALPATIWRTADPDDQDNCVDELSATGTVWTHPDSGPDSTQTTADSAPVGVSRCGLYVSMSTDSNVAGVPTRLMLDSHLPTSSDGQFGFSASLPGNLWVNFDAAGSLSDKCPSFSLSIPDGFGKSFDNSSCPPQSKVGTATLGDEVGSIYLIGTTPLATFGVYFDNAPVPYGRLMQLSWDGDLQQMQLDIAGLHNIASGGLRLDFYNPLRALGSKIWTSPDPGNLEDCAGTEGTASVKLFPLQGGITPATFDFPLHREIEC